MKFRLRGLFMFLYMIFGLYFLNYPFQFVKIPESLSSFESWIIFVGGILILFGGFSYFRTSRY